jgi:hypothetical protein
MALDDVGLSLACDAEAVFTDECHDRYYNGLCIGALWPLLHSFPNRPLRRAERRDLRSEPSPLRPGCWSTAGPLRRMRKRHCNVELNHVDGKVGLPDSSANLRRGIGETHARAKSWICR